MTVKAKLALAAIVLLIISALFGVALTDKVFFTTLYLDQGETIENSDGSVEIPFYLYKDAWQEYKANVINLTVVRTCFAEMVMMSLEMDPLPVTV